MEEHIKNIVELDIDLDNVELFDMGVTEVSFVTEPAIEVDFMAFKSEEEAAKEEQVEEIILKWADEHGELITEEHTYIKEGEEFASVTDVAKITTENSKTIFGF